MKLKPLKIGDTFSVVLDCKFDEPSLEGWLITARSRLPSGGVLSGLSLDLTRVAESVVVVYAAATHTALWKVGVALIDVHFIDPAGVAQSTETFELNVLSAP